MTLFRVTLFTVRDSTPKFEQLLDTIVKYDVNTQSGIQSCIGKFGSARIGWADKTHGITHMHFLTAKDETSLQNYAKSTVLLDRFEGVILPNLMRFEDRIGYLDSFLNSSGITDRQQAKRKDIVVFDSILQLPTPFTVKDPEKCLLHVCLYNLSDVDEEETEKLNKFLKDNFNTRAGINSQISVYSSLAEDRDRSCGYTHAQVIVADDLDTLKELLDATVHNTFLNVMMGSRMQSMLVFDIPLPPEMVTELDLTAKISVKDVFNSSVF